MNSNLKNKITFTEQNRVIGITASSVSGLYPFKKKQTVPFESMLEKDFLIRLETFGSVLDVVAQPFTLNYVSAENKTRQYTPDFLVSFKSSPWPYRAPELIEVKPNKFLQEQLTLQKDKYKAAFQFCRENGYIFHFMDEYKIHDQRFTNANFLKRFNGHEVDDIETQWILDSFQKKPIMTFDHILAKHYNGSHYRAIGIRQIWAMIASGKLECDLSQKLDFQTELWEPTYE